MKRKSESQSTLYKKTARELKKSEIDFTHCDNICSTFDVDKYNWSVCGRTVDNLKCNPSQFQTRADILREGILRILSERIGIGRAELAKADAHSLLEMLVPEVKDTKSSDEADCERLAQASHMIRNDPRCKPHHFCYVYNCHPCARLAQKSAEFQDLVLREAFRFYGPFWKSLDSTQDAWDAVPKKDLAFEYDFEKEDASTLYLIMNETQYPPCSSIAALQRFKSMTDIEKWNTTPLYLFPWFKNSCYCHAATVALFGTFPARWITSQLAKAPARLQKHILKLREEKNPQSLCFYNLDAKSALLREKETCQVILKETLNVMQAMRAKPVSRDRTVLIVPKKSLPPSSLRSLLDKCPSQTVSKFGTVWQDANEFLTRWMNILFLTEPEYKMQTTVTRISNKTGATQQEPRIDSLTAPLMSLTMPQDFSRGLLSDVISLNMNESNEVREGRLKKESKLVGSVPFMVFTLSRLTMGESAPIVNRSVCLPDQDIKLGSSQLSLRSVISYTKSHYVVFFYHEGVWFYYDDLSKKPLEQLDFFLMQQDVSRTGVTFVYEEI